MGYDNRAIAIAVLLLLTLCFLSFRSSNSNNNIRSQGKFAPISPHKASSGDDLGIDKNQGSKVIDSGHFKAMVSAASTHTRKRKMTDLTKKPEENSMQVSKDS